MPVTVLRTLQGSVNSTSGKLGELVQFIELQRAYDRLIPVGNIVDFVAVKFPTAESPGVVHFIDVKTGKRAVLSKDQKRLKGIIDDKLVEFHTVKMEVT
jgi:predicted Holliday junction resolvase-like endonuclease